MTVAEYKNKFMELSRFAPSQVASEEDRIFMFQRGLRPDILSRVEMVEPRTYGESTKKAIIAEQGIANETKGIKIPRETGIHPEITMVVTMQTRREHQLTIENHFKGHALNVDAFTLLADSAMACPKPVTPAASSAT